MYSVKTSGTYFSHCVLKLSTDGANARIIINFTTKILFFSFVTYLKIPVQINHLVLKILYMYVCVCVYVYIYIYIYI